MNEIETARPDTERFHGDAGANLVEYAMLMALVVVVCLAAVTFFGNAASSKLYYACDNVVSSMQQTNCATGS